MKILQVFQYIGIFGTSFKKKCRYYGYYTVLQLQFSVNTLPCWELGKWIDTQIDEKDQISMLTQFDGSYDMEEQKNVVKAKMMCNFSEEFMLEAG